MEREKVLEECVEYFKARPVYRKLFRQMYRKYASLGHLGGTVVLTGLDREEKEQLGGFFQKDYTENKSISISAAFMKKALGASRFSCLSWEEILEAYNGQPLVVNKEIQKQQEEQKELYFRSIMEQCRDERGKSWLHTVLSERKNGYPLLLQQYKENPKQLEITLLLVLEAIRELPLFSGKKKELLPVFAAGITGNPHFFDEGTTGEKLLTAFLKEQITDNAVQTLSGTEYKNRLFYEAGLLKDDLSNDVLAYGIRAWKKGGELHAGLEGFWTCREAVKLTLKTLGELETICPAESNEVYVVENPAVFSVLTEIYPERAVVCGNGQLRLAVLVLLDRLAENSSLYYSGDFDPEGLLIAQRLKLRYKERLKLWNYDVSWYRMYQSDVTLSDARVKKLDHIHLKELEEIRDAMRVAKKAAYQETMIDK